MNTTEHSRINRRIAELRGWQIEAGALDYDLIAPDGRRIDTGYAVEVWTLDQVWENIWSHSGYTRPPQPATDMNAAWDLAIEAQLVVFPTFNGWAAARCMNRYIIDGGVKIDRERMYGGMGTRGDADTAQMAICRAWVNWKYYTTESATP